MQCNELYKMLDSCSVFTNDMSHDRWYNFFNNAYSQLVTTHAALFGGLVAIATAVFALKYWTENVQINKTKEELNLTKVKASVLSQKLNDAETKISTLEKNYAESLNIMRKYYIKSIIVNKGKGNINNQLLKALDEWLGSSSNDDDDWMIIGMLNDFFEDFKSGISSKIIKDDEKIISGKIAAKLSKCYDKNSDRATIVDLDRIITFFDSLSKQKTAK